jgi:hypothetical protein
MWGDPYWAVQMRNEERIKKQGGGIILALRAQPEILLEIAYFFSCHFLIFLNRIYHLTSIPYIGT